MHADADREDLRTRIFKHGGSLILRNAVQGNGKMITSIATKVFSLIFGAVAAYCLYNVFLHPLRSHRGPRSWACTRIPWMWHNVKGDLAQKLVELHEAYGPVVRIAPDELSYAKASAWRDIYGERSGTEMAKALDGRGIAPTHYDGDHSILQAPTPETHRRLRRLLQPAFTESAMLNEEPLIRKNVNNLMRILRTHARNGSAPVDLTRLFVEAVFDVLGDLGFGESFNTLDGGAEGQAIVNTGLKAAKAVVFLRVAFFYRMEKLMKFITPPSVARSRQQLISLTTQRLEARLKKPATARPDFFSFVLAGSEKNNSGSDQLSLHELVLMAVVFIGAGTLTTAFSAVAAIYLLCNNEIAYLRLREELDDAFSNQEDITLSSTRQLKFLQAVIKETLRIYPPVPGTLPRVVPVGGAFVDGDWIPGGVSNALISVFMPVVEVLTRIRPLLECTRCLPSARSITSTMLAHSDRSAGLIHALKSSRRMSGRLVSPSPSDPATVSERRKLLFLKHFLPSKG